MIYARSFRPFDGAHNLGDLARIALIVASFAMLGVIGRTIVEGRRLKNMNRGQIMRLLGVAGLAASASLRSASRFGAPLNAYVIANIIFVAIEAVGVMYLRRDQRALTSGEANEPPSHS